MNQPHIGLPLPSRLIMAASLMSIKKWSVDKAIEATDKTIGGVDESEITTDDLRVWLAGFGMGLWDINGTELRPETDELTRVLVAYAIELGEKKAEVALANGCKCDVNIAIRCLREYISSRCAR